MSSSLIKFKSTSLKNVSRIELVIELKSKLELKTIYLQFRKNLNKKQTSPSFFFLLGRFLAQLCLHIHILIITFYTCIQTYICNICICMNVCLYRKESLVAAVIESKNGSDISSFIFLNLQSRQYESKQTIQNVDFYYTAMTMGIQFHTLELKLNVK